MIKKIFLSSAGVVVGLAIMLLLGMFLNSGKPGLNEALAAKGIRTPENVSLVVYSSRNVLELYSDTTKVKEYRVFTGGNPNPKRSANDRGTPVGTYSICSIDTQHTFHRFLRLNFPNPEDAETAYRHGIISKKEFEDIKYQYFYEGCISPKTGIGGNIGLHGTGSLNFLLNNLPFVFNWTDGSIAMSDEEIDELFIIVRKGTKVVIKP